LLTFIRQFEAHLKGKKHIKSVDALRRKMKVEDEILGVSDGLSTSDNSTPTLVPSFDVLKQENHDTDTEPFDANGDKVLESPLPLLNPPLDSSVGPEPEPETGIDQQTFRKDFSRLKTNSEPIDITESTDSSDSEQEEDLSQGLNELLLGTSGGRNEKLQESQNSKKKIGAAKVKRQRRAEKRAATDAAEGKSQTKPRKPSKPYDPVTVMQKARGETTITGRRVGKRK
jgi:hypothetical protein